jgi:sugar O-acyltransferase (sialic acid O-acetyltransferase NeuD family)
MPRYAIYGAGGFGKEVRGMLDRLKIGFAGFIDDHKKELNTATEASYDDILFAIADGKIREDLVNRFKGKEFTFASIVSPDVWLHRSVQLGKGCIVCPGVQMTVDISLGDFVIVNLNATVGHDVRVGDFCSIMPSANISGNVSLGKGVLVGSGATILQGLTIGDRTVIGAGAVVTRSLPAGVTVMGVPARVKK